MSDIQAVEVTDDVTTKRVTKLGGGFGQFMRNLTGNRVLVYSFRRILTIIPLFIGISIITFVLMYLIGDPLGYLVAQNPRITPADIDRIRQQLGLDRPPIQQYLIWLGGFVRFDLGLTFFTRIPVLTEIGHFLTETLKLQVTSFLISLVISILLGVTAARFQNSWIDSGVSALALLGLSMPIFVFGNLLIFVFAGRNLQWFPAGKSQTVGIDEINWSAMWDGRFGEFFRTFFVFTNDTIWYMVLPVATLVFASLALFTRLVRGSMLEILRQDYILAARANGLSERSVLIGHGLRNALLPVVTFIGLFVGGVLAGAPITETVFSYPGLGSKFVEFINKLDHPLIMGISMVITLMILIANLLTDIAYVWVDPRIEL